MIHSVHAKLKAQREGFEGFSLNKNKTLRRRWRNVAEITQLCERAEICEQRNNSPRWGRFNEQMEEMKNVAGRQPASWEISGVFVIFFNIGPMLPLLITPTNEGSR